MTLKNNYILVVALLMLAGCATEKVTLSTYGKQVEVRVPQVEVDRYEAVVFPAGRLQER